MKKKKKRDISRTRAVQNNVYTFKLLWGISRRRVGHTVLREVLGYFNWVFYSAFFMRYIVDAIQNEKGFFTIFKFILIMAFVSVLCDIHGSYLRGTVEPLTDTIIYQKLYQMLYRKSRNVELRCFEDSDFYNKYTMAIDGAADKVCKIIRCMCQIVFSTISAGIIFYTMYTIDHTVVLFIIAPILGNFVFSVILNKLYYQRYTDTTPHNRVMDYVNRVMHLADYSKEMRMSNVFSLMKNKFDKAEKGVEEVADKYKKRVIFYTFFNDYLTYTIIFEGVLLYGSYQAIVYQSVSLADLAVLTGVMTTATYITMNLLNALMDLFNNGVFIENLRAFLEYKETLPEDYDGMDAGNSIDSIEFRNVSFAYVKEKPILRNISFTINKNSKTALVGHNGAGKTTLIKLLFRLYDVDEGEILLNGRNIKDYNLRSYRNLFAAAFQDYRVFAMSIKENVLMGTKFGTEEEEEERVYNALKKAGLYEKVMTFDSGINKNLTKEFDGEGVVLSGGEYQKLIAARAFIQDSPVKVFDEPSSALDPIAEYRLFESIMEEGNDKTMIFISHRLSSVQNANQVFMLENGEIIERGSHKELLNKKGVYADMFYKQAKNYLADDLSLPDSLGVSM